MECGSGVEGKGVYLERAGVCRIETRGSGLWGLEHEIQGVSGEVVLLREEFEVDLLGIVEVLIKTRAVSVSLL